MINAERKPYDALLLRETGGGYTAFVTFPDRVEVTFEAPTWPALRAALREAGLSIGRVLERDVRDGLGVLERAFR